MTRIATEELQACRAMAIRFRRVGQPPVRAKRLALMAAFFAVISLPCTWAVGQTTRKGYEVDLEPGTAVPVPGPLSLVKCPEQPQPEWPAEALRAGISGEVQAVIFIEEGKVAKIDMQTGPAVLRPAVERALQGFVCKPGLWAMGRQAFRLQGPINNSPLPGDPNDVIQYLCPLQPKPGIPANLSGDKLPAEVKAKIVVNKGVVKDISFVSGPLELRPAVRKAVSGYGCIHRQDAEVVYQSFTFPAR